MMFNRGGGMRRNVAKQQDVEAGVSNTSHNHPSLGTWEQPNPFTRSAQQYSDDNVPGVQPETIVSVLQKKKQITIRTTEHDHRTTRAAVSWNPSNCRKGSITNLPWVHLKTQSSTSKTTKNTFGP